MTTVRYTVHQSPLGALVLTLAPTGALAGCWFPDGRHAARVEPGWRRDATPFTDATAQLDAYFGGELVGFDLELAPRGTSFQLEVWHALRAIPFGQTVSYRTVAEQVGRPGAARAVGAANARNPIGVVVPCHRVVGSGGALVGYGGGLDRKRWLLDHERRVAGEDRASRVGSGLDAPRSGASRAGPHAARRLA